MRVLPYVERGSGIGNCPSRNIDGYFPNADILLNRQEAIDAAGNERSSHILGPPLPPVAHGQSTSGQCRVIY